MAIAFRNGLRLAGIGELGRESCSLAPVSKALGPLKRQIPSTNWSLKCSSKEPNNVENPVEATNSNAWWGVGHDNFREITSEKDLFDSLMNAGKKLVVVQFYSPACGGCRPLHPKMYQIAEEQREIIFLKVNFEEHQLLCHNLRVVVLPFFQFYRGAKRICSFSCTLNTIYKMKNALKKHGNEQGYLEPAKGSDEGAPVPVKGLVRLDEDAPELVKGLAEGELLNLVSVEVSGNNGDLALSAA